MPTRNTTRRTRPSRPAEPEGLDPAVEARLLARAREVLGDEAIARRWLDEPILALGGIAPRVMATRRGGVQMVEDVLGRIAFGGYS